MSVTYPLDMSGVSPTNLVKNEIHTTSESRFKDYNFIVPLFAPFYVDNFGLVLKTGEVLRPLVEDVDFSFALPYVTGTRTTGKQMYGSVTLHNLEMNGILLMQYQTIGGDQIVDRLHVLTHLADKAYNPRTTIWDIVTDVPNALPPTPHYQDYDSMFGQEQVVAALVAIRDAIVSNSSLTSETIRNFLDTYNNERGGFVMRSGDVMTGQLTLPGMPVDELHAASKKYVDARLADQSSITTLLSQYVKDTDFHFNMELKLDKTGGLMTGPIALHADPVQDDQPATKRYTDQTVSTLANKVAQLEEIINIIVNNNGVSKQYVDDLVNQVTLRFSAYK